MKKTILKSVLIAILVGTGFISCSSDPTVSNDNAIVSKPTPPGLTGLFYRENGTLSYSTVSNPLAKASSKTIFGINGSSNVIEIRLTSLAVGTYTIGSLNKFYYKKPLTTSTWTAFTGSVTITSNALGKLSGTYTMTSGTGNSSVNSINGFFELIPINP